MWWADKVKEYKHDKRVVEERKAGSYSLKRANHESFW